LRENPSHLPHCDFRRSNAFGQVLTATGNDLNVLGFHSHYSNLLGYHKSRKPIFYNIEKNALAVPLQLLKRRIAYLKGVLSMFKKKLLVVAALMMFIVGKPLGAQANEAELFGAVIGAVTGGFIGSNIGSGDGQLAATAAGTLVGAMAGHSLAQRSYYLPQHGNHHFWNSDPEPIYVAPKPRRKFVTHNHRVIVHHVHPERYHNRQLRKWRKMKRKWHRYRKQEQRMKNRCFYRPRRCEWFN
tara:strand:+ start:156 stop:881 length:726 start_codon:yes stop_codon:yes gene_type:complete